MIEHIGLHTINSADATDFDTVIEPASKTRYAGLEDLPAYLRKQIAHSIWIGLIFASTCSGSCFYRDQ